MLKKLGLAAIPLALVWNVFAPQRSLVKVKLDKEYDYVIVGAGSAGAILAARLSEDPDVTVALLEAGPDNDHYPEANMPISFLKLFAGDLNWGYWTERQNKSCHGLIEERSAWASGRALGGSSLLNAMMVSRCNPHDYQLWAELGNEGWGYEDVLPYFKKLETVTKEEWKRSGFRGSEGPIIVTEGVSNPEATAVFLEAAKMQGFEIKDTNGDTNENRMMAFQGNIDKRGVRQSTAVSYLKPVMHRANLDVLTEAHVTQVLFEAKRAVGVKYVHRGLVHKVKGRIEVILSAGVIGSPQLLMLSGVGPRKHLEDMKIRVVADLPVGENLRDHIMTDAVVATLEKPVGLVLSRLGLRDLLQYKLLGSGVLAELGILGTGFTKSKYQPSERKQPYLQYFIFGTLFNDEEGQFRKAFNYKPEVHEALYGGLEGRDGVVIATALLQPESVGSVRLRSCNPFDHPVIDPNYLASEQDVKVLIDGIRRAQKLMTSSPFTEQLGAQLLSRVHPGCVNEAPDSDAYWACYVRSNTLTAFHPVSTCRMGPAGDPDTVVDSQLRVHGLSGLRVVDASIMPLITSGNTNFPTMMIAEKAADVIRKARKCPTGGC